MPKSRLDHFAQGMGIEPPQYTCATCGYTSDKRRNFRRSEEGEGHVCSTGHYVNKEGETKRAINPYARPR
jgi:hypothetical protein